MNDLIKRYFEKYNFEILPIITFLSYFDKNISFFSPKSNTFFSKIYVIHEIIKGSFVHHESFYKKKYKQS